MAARDPVDEILGPPKAPHQPPLHQPQYKEGSMIELENVAKIYAMGNVEVPALRGVTLTIQAGEMVAIMGPRAQASPP